MSARILGIKIDVDTERGTRIGVPELLRLFDDLGVRATFLFSLGPDNTGRAIRRIFRPGFFQKVSRTSVVSVYGWKTLLNGVLWPGPHIGRRHADIMRRVRAAGHEVGIHCYDHVRWQDGLASMTQEQVNEEFGRALSEFDRIFGCRPRVAGSAGWQANAFSLAAYDRAGLDYASDARGTSAFYPKVGRKVFRTLQLPTTLPTVDELLGRAEYPRAELASRYFSWITASAMHVHTAHAELEGMTHIVFFRDLLARLHASGWHIGTLGEIVSRLRLEGCPIGVSAMEDGHVDGRSGTLALQVANEPGQS